SLDSQEPLDATELYRHLSVADEMGSQAGLGRAALAEILSESTYMHAGFARPGRAVEQARQGWKSIWSKHLHEQLQVDLQSAKNRYREEASDDNYARLMALREQIESLTNEMNDPDRSESA